MAKTQDFQRELYQLMANVGELDMYLVALRREIEAKNSEKNTLHQKIERLQKDFRAFLSNKPPVEKPQPFPEAAPSESAPTPEPIAAEASSDPTDQNPQN